MTCQIKKISIIIPCYNMGLYLEETINSVLKQSYKNYDLYLVNNGSSDDSLKIMKKFMIIDKRIKIINHKNKTPKGKSINELLAKIKTKWVAILDADDIYFKNKIYKQIKFLEKNHNVKLLSCLAAYTVDGKNKFGVTNNVFKNLSSCYQIINNGQNIGVLAPGVIFDREIALKIGGIRYEYWPADDVDLSNRIVESGYIVYSLPEVLMLYRLNKFSSMFSFKSFIDGKKKSNWVKYNLLRRKSKKKEFSFKKFLLVSKKQTYFLKLISNLNYTFDFLFRLIPYYILKKNYLYFFLIVLISLLINPLRFLRKIKDRYN